MPIKVIDTVAFVRRVSADLELSERRRGIVALADRVTVTARARVTDEQFLTPTALGHLHGGAVYDIDVVSRAPDADAMFKFTTSDGREILAAEAIPIMKEHAASSDTGRGRRASGGKSSGSSYSPSAPVVIPGAEAGRQPEGVIQKAGNVMHGIAQGIRNTASAAYNTAEAGKAVFEILGLVDRAQHYGEEKAYMQQKREAEKAKIGRILEQESDAETTSQRDVEEAEKVRKRPLKNVSSSVGGKKVMHKLNEGRRMAVFMEE